MCSECEDNGPQCLVSVSIADYAAHIEKKDDFKIRLFVELQGKLIFRLYKHTITPRDKIHQDVDLCKAFWKECGLNFAYPDGLAYGLRAAFISKAKSTLALISSKEYKAFKPVGSGNKLRLLWNDTVVKEHFSCEKDVISWYKKHKEAARKKAEKAEKAETKVTKAQRRKKFAVRSKVDRLKKQLMEAEAAAAEGDPELSA